MQKKRILFPTDFSDCANNALTYAISLTKYLKGHLTLFHAYHLPVSMAELPGSMVIEEVKKESEEKLERIVQGIEEDNTDISCDFVVKHGFAVEKIIDYTTQNKPDWVVMGAKGASGIERFILGNVTINIIQASGSPVIAVPECASFQGISQIIFATDYGSHDIEAIVRLLPLARSFNASLTILHISLPGEKSSEAFFDDFVRLAKSKLSYEKLYFKCIDLQNVKTGLDSVIENNKADLIAMSTRKKSFWENLFLGSHTKKMLYHTHKPLLTFNNEDS